MTIVECLVRGLEDYNAIYRAITVITGISLGPHQHQSKLRYANNELTE